MNRCTWILIVVGLAAAPVYSQISRESVGAGTQGNGHAQEVAISADGRYVAFSSLATNLVPGATTGQVYVRDRQMNLTTVASQSSAGVYGDQLSAQPAMSADGRFVAFTSNSTNLGPTSGISVFVHDRVTGTTSLVSASTAGVMANIISVQPAVSADGRFVAFVSRATNLLDGMPLPLVSVGRVYVRDVLLSVTTLVSIDGTGAPAPGEHPTISADGRFVTFTSANALVSGDNNNAKDIYLRDRQLGTTELISATPGGFAGSNHSLLSSISADGRYIAFSSQAADLVSYLGLIGQHIFLRDRLTQTTSLVSVDATGVPVNGAEDWPAISADGLHVAFNSFGSTFVPGDTNAVSDVFVRDLLSGHISRLSVANDGTQGNSHSPAYVSNGPFVGSQGFTTEVAVSGDGRYVAFSSEASNFALSDTNASADVFLVDRSCTVQLAEFGQGLAGTGGATPLLLGFDGSCTGGAAIVIAGGRGGAAAAIAASPARATTPIPLLGGLVYLDISQPILAVPVTLYGSPGVPAGGSLVITGLDLSAIAGQTLYLQAFITDPAASAGFSMTNGLSISIL